MNIIGDIMDFFIRLVRGRIDQVEMKAKSKVMGIQHQAKSAASRQFNQAVDGAVGKVKHGAGAAVGKSGSAAVQSERDPTKVRSGTPPK